jgi:CheY-like chemotaxis protein
VPQRLSSLIKYSLERAAQARKRAAESGDPIDRHLEHGWGTLARSQDFTERLGRFLANRQAAGQMFRQSTESGAHRAERDHSATIPGKRLISIVEDDRGVRESLGRLLACWGYASGTFTTAEEYLESGLVDETACLICDVQLPEMSGPDLQARLIAEGHRIPIVFVTGSFSEITRARVLTAGALDYFAKPFSPGALIGCLEKALASTPF